MFQFRTFIIALLSILVSGLSISFAQDTASFPQVTVTYTNDSITVSPAEVSSGLTTLVLDNQSDSHAGGPIGHLQDGMSPEEFASAAAQNPLTSILALDLYGSLSGAPGDNQSITVDLQPGIYIFLGQAGMMGTMTVTDAGATTVPLPEHDINVVMVDFAYGIPSVLPTGEQLWKIRNEGEQIHEILILPVDADTTLREATDMFRSMGNIFNVMAGTSPVVPQSIWGPLSPDKVAWVPVTLEPGTYALGGLLPDFTTMGAEGAPAMQIDHGMVRIITVE